MQFPRLGLVLVAFFFTSWLATSPSLASPITVPVISTFASGLDGWSGPDIRFVAAVGNPAGSLEFQELYSANASYALAPAKFLGDWSALDGTGVISYDHRVQLQFDPGFWGAAVPREIVLEGPGGVATWTGSLPNFNSSFVTITAPLSASNWIVNSGTWGGLLSDVTAFRLRVDHYNDLFGAERTQFDNILLNGPGPGPGPSPVPEPTSLLLLGTGLAAAAYRRWRKAAAAAEGD
jgi:hypothetical protein